MDPSLSFSNNFWGKTDAGVTALVGKMHQSKQTLEEVHSFYKERCAIEDEYARKLLALSRKGLGSQESGTLKEALDVIRRNTESMAKSHSSAASQISKQLAQPLDTFSSSLRSRRKTVEVTIEKTTKAKKSQNAAVEKARARFESDCNKINGYTAQQNLLLGKELEKNNLKLERTQAGIEGSKRDYQNAVRALAETIDRWNREWKQACDKFQDLEEERINFLKSNLWAYTNIISTVCVSDDEGCESVRVSLETCDVNKDIESFIKKHGTGQEIQDPPEFVNFMNGISRDNNENAYKIANFARDPSDAAANTSYQSYADTSFTGTDDGSEQDPDRSIGSFSRLSDHSTGPSPSSFKTGLLNMLSQAPTIPKLNFGRSNSPIPDAESDEEGEMLALHAPPPQQSIMQSYEPPALSNIPDLTHSQNSNYSQNSSPRMSPQPSPNMNSVYSATSLSDSQSSQGSTDSRTRTWSSPFRRKSTQDINKGWNENTNNRTSTDEFRGTSAAGNYAQETLKRSTGSTMSNPAPVLSMGENMFDLGINPRSNNNSRQQMERPKSYAGPKGYTKNDPLVAALERLKTPTTSTGSNDLNDSTTLAKNYGSLGLGGSNGPLVGAPKRVISRSAPTSPNPYSSRPGASGFDSALAPPRSAHTASSMQSTSSAYSSQTQEMFNERGRMQRPKSSVDLYSTANSFFEGQQQQQQQRTHSPGPARSRSPAPFQIAEDGPYKTASPNPNSGHRTSGSFMSMDGNYGRSQSSTGSYATMHTARSSEPLRPTPKKSMTNLHCELPQVARDGRRVIKYAKANYDYRAAIPEEVSFKKGDALLVLRMQQDGWWEVEVANKHHRVGLAPSNFLAPL